jgi:outer membrane receptor protein involved in Fe transport
MNSVALYSSAYAYASVSLTDKATAIFGAAADRVETAFVQSSQISPKLGLMLEPTAKTTIRATAFRTLEGPLVSRYSIQPRLEPTHVMGFNQYFFGIEGEEATRAGLAIDHELSTNLFSGVELSQRSVDLRGIAPLPDGSTIVVPVDREERLLRSYVYWTPTSRMSVAAEYQHERVDGDGDRLVDGFERLETRRIPVSLNLFNARNLHTGIRATYVAQEGNFSPFETFPAPVIEPGSDAFWVVDLSLSYRLPKRRGAVSLSLDNAFDEEFRFQDTDPENQSIMPERMLAFRFTMSY